MINKIIYLYIKLNLKSIFKIININKAKAIVNKNFFIFFILITYILLSFLYFLNI